MYRTIVSQLEGEKHLRVSDWVHVSHDGVRITGFIVEIWEAVVKIRITDPKNRGNVLMVKKSDIQEAKHALHSQDIRSLIDLALELKDEEWFNQLVRELRKRNELEKTT